MLEEFKGIPLFKDVPAYFLAGLEAECHKVTLEKGEFLFQQGDEGNGMYIIAEGVIQIVVNTDDEQNKVVAELSSGQPFGEIALLEKNKRIAGARAKEKSRLLFLDNQKYYELIKSNDPNALRISHNISLMLVERLEIANKLISDLTSTPAKHENVNITGKKATAEREVAKFKAKLLNEGLF